MTTEPNTQSVTIFGSEYKIRGADPDYIQVVAAYVDGKMRELEGRIPPGTPAKLAILTSLNIADELFREREERTRRDNELRERTREWGRLLTEGTRES
ncbi:MAG TPA: cell division protein ZapA [Candidatus Eisenbacteria bacterium]|jgi:cell division protein ZapA|nr:cell division protein ZapA [Candidatus Eisenbacteria bacterium]HTK68731.1 cell division protein ZapA [Candidatus Eisenbacteria bacterium]